MPLTDLLQVAHNRQYALHRLIPGSAYVPIWEGLRQAARYVSIDSTLLSEPCGTDPLICAVLRHGAVGRCIVLASRL